MSTKTDFQVARSHFYRVRRHARNHFTFMQSVKFIGEKAELLFTLPLDTCLVVVDAETDVLRKVDNQINDIYRFLDDQLKDQTMIDDAVDEHNKKAKSSKK